MKYVKVKDLGQIITGNTPPTTDESYYGDFMPFIKATDIQLNSRFTYITEQCYSEKSYNKYKANLVPKGSTCIVTIGSIGKKMTQAHTDLFVNQAINAILPNERYDKDYVYYLTRYAVLPQLKIYDSGTTSGRENISKSSFSNIRLFVEDNINNQKKIASILSAYDNLIENNNKRIRLLEQMAENLYKEWFVRFRFPGHEKAEFENGLPKGWVYAKLEDILSLKDSVRIPLSSLERSNMQKKYPYYGAASILDYVDDYLFDGVYLLLGEDGSVIDENGYPYIQYVWGRFWVNNHAHVIEKKGVYSVEFLYCLFKRMNIQSVVTGVAQPKISQGRLFNKKVIKPCDSIISLFDKQIQPIFAGIRQLTEENNNLSRQRDLLLPRLMSGKLEVNV